jgi:hypothetical protein
MLGLGATAASQQEIATSSHAQRHRHPAELEARERALLVDVRSGSRSPGLIITK